MSSTLKMSPVRDVLPAIKTLTEQRYYRGLEYNKRKKSHGSSPGEARKIPRGNDCPLESTAHFVAEEFGVSPRTIKNDAQFAEQLEKLPEEKLADVLAVQVDRERLDLRPPWPDASNKVTGDDASRPDASSNGNVAKTSTPDARLKLSSNNDKVVIVTSFGENRASGLVALPILVLLLALPFFLTDQWETNCWLTPSSAATLACVHRFFSSSRNRLWQICHNRFSS
jgi:hypothetical protein